VRIVNVGPGVGGKTTNLRKIHEQFPEFRMAGLAAEGERTVGGDPLPVALGEDPIGDGWELTVSLSSVPGQLQYGESRAGLLRTPTWWCSSRTAIRAGWTPTSTR
jgi:hypothetical protein